ncbi:putative uncharacterized protein [[Eubacterium] siraeum CAG:80]|uniref:Uncharacterized protein n=1 Tax=[Eubacterium] siraeum CAG:80 TaxID=1263080 RepID=R6RUG0_9FIRM|nr:putative uncharacterized protein [[Eubacterium] siraeum CAG:80]
MHFNVKNVIQLDEALHELPIHDSGITSIENEVSNKELLIHLSNLYENKKIELLFGCVDIFKTAISGDYDQGDDVITLYHERSKEAFKKIVKDNNISYDKSLYFVLQLFSGKEYHIVCKSIDVQVIQLNRCIIIY